MRLRFLIPIPVLAILLTGCFETSYEPHGIIERDSIQYSVRETTPFPAEIFTVKPKPIAWDSVRVCLESQSLSLCQTSILGYRYVDYKNAIFTTDKFSPSYLISYVAFKHDREFDSGSFAIPGAGRPARANVPEEVEIGDPDIRIRFKLDYSDSLYHADFKVDGKDYTQIHGIDFFARNASVKFIGYHPRFGGQIILEGSKNNDRVALNDNGGDYEIRIDSLNTLENRIDLLATRIAIVLSRDTLPENHIQCYESIHDELGYQWNLARVRPSQLRDEGGGELDLDPAIVLPFSYPERLLIIDKMKNGYACTPGGYNDPWTCRLIPHILP